MSSTSIEVNSQRMKKKIPTNDSYVYDTISPRKFNEIEKNNCGCHDEAFLHHFYRL
jgi:hypothetical protein